MLADLGLAVASQWMFAPELERGVVRAVLQEWALPSIDLWAVLRDQLITGTRLGLKTAAKLAGFEWRGEGGGGALAMVRYAEAVAYLTQSIREIAERAGN